MRYYPITRLQLSERLMNFKQSLSILKFISRVAIPVAIPN